MTPPSPERVHEYVRAFGTTLSDTIAQCLNLEREIYHTGSKLCILGFEPLKSSLIAERTSFGDMSIRTASWLPSTLPCKLQAQHILCPV